MALPLGELSPKVTERVLQAFLNGDINLCAHAAKIHINISVGETQDLQSKRCQKCVTAGRFPVDCCPLVWSCFPSQSAAPTALPKGEPSSARNALHRTVYRSAPLLSVRQTGSCQFFLFSQQRPLLGNLNAFNKLHFLRSNFPYIMVVVNHITLISKIVHKLTIR